MIDFDTAVKEVNEWLSDIEGSEFDVNTFAMSLEYGVAYELFKHFELDVRSLDSIGWLDGYPSVVLIDSKKVKKLL